MIEYEDLKNYRALLVLAARHASPQQIERKLAEIEREEEQE